jgi:hypothetical protein
MSGPEKFKFVDAIKTPEGESAEAHGGKPAPSHATEAEQVRESHEASEAKNAQASARDHMVDIGRGNQQAGRQGQ